MKNQIKNNKFIYLGLNFACFLGKANIEMSILMFDEICLTIKAVGT